MIKSKNGRVKLDGDLATLLTDIRLALLAICEEDNEDFNVFCDKFFYTLNPRITIEELTEKVEKQFTQDFEDIKEKLKSKRESRGK